MPQDTIFPIGTVLANRYRIVKLLGQGGFGAVYRAWDMNLNSPCAVKENFGTSPEAVRQFTFEATVLANLRHVNLPTVIDHFSLPGQGQLLVMDYVAGEDLQEKIEQAGLALSEAQVLPWIDQVCDALIYLHSQNPPVIHRDIKPANLKITPQGQAKLVDFGIAKIFVASTKTARGARAVTPGYSPPEQYGRGATDERSDIYALGATLYAALTGQPPVESIQRSLEVPLPMPRTLNPEISPHIEWAILKAMEMDPGDRFQHVVDFRAALAPLRQTAQVFQQAGSQPYVQAPPKPSDAPIPQAERSSARKWLPVGVGILAGILLFFAFLVGILLFNGFSFLKQPTATRTPAPEAIVLPATPTSPLPTLLPPTQTALLEIKAPTQTSTATPTPWPTNTPPPPSPSPLPTSTEGPWSPCPGLYISRLHIGDRAYVSFDPPLRNNVRTRPDQSAELLGKIEPGERVKILDGPACADHMIWWYVSSSKTGLTGWTSEGDRNSYWLVPDK